MDNKTIATRMVGGIEQRVNECHGWCEITPLSGELHEEIFMATFADDSRIVFEDDQNGFLHVLLTKEQTENWDGCYVEEQINMLEEILLFYRRYMKDKGLKVIENRRTQYEVILRLTVTDCIPSHWDWARLLSLPEADVALTKCKEVGNEV